jgi:hypothetical protein
VHALDKLVDIATKAALGELPALIAFGGESTGTEMNDFDALGLQNLSQVGRPFPRAAAGKNPGQLATVVTREALLGFTQALKATGQRTTILVLLAAYDAYLGHVITPLQVHGSIMAQRGFVLATAITKASENRKAKSDVAPREIQTVASRRPFQQR